MTKLGKRTGLGGRGVVDITGQRFGRVVVLSLVTSSPVAQWLCRCDCGNEKAIRGDHLDDPDVERAKWLLDNSAKGVELARSLAIGGCITTTPHREGKEGE